MLFQAKWIQVSEKNNKICPVFKKKWNQLKPVVKGVLYLTALGTYEAKLNGKRISDYVLAPGWTVYEKRLQYQEYDITDMLQEENELTVVLGKGWFASRMPGWKETEDKARRMAQPQGIIGEIHLTFEDGRKQIISTDTSWLWGESQIRFSDIYDGETMDASFTTNEWKNVSELEWSKEILIPQEGELIKEMELVTVIAKNVFGFLMALLFQKTNKYNTLLRAAIFMPAAIDGASYWQKVRYITLPLIIQSFTVTFVLNLVSGIKVFSQVYGTTNGGPANATEVLGTFLYKSFGQGFLGYSSAVGLFTTIIIMVLAFSLLAVLRKREVEM